MFGFSFGEIVVLVIVGIVVVGPRKLPAMMRSAGQWVGKLRRMSTELRAQSGIDDLIRQEGLEREIRELRALSRVNVIETLVTPVVGSTTAGSVVTATPRLPAKAPEPPPEEPMVQPLREREYPVLGCDSYGAYPEGEAPEEAAAAAEGEHGKGEEATGEAANAKNDKAEGSAPNGAPQGAAGAAS